MPVIETRETAIAIAALVVILFAALFFIVTTASLALLYFQLTSLATAVLVVAAAWVLSKFSHSLAIWPEHRRAQSLTGLARGPSRPNRLAATPCDH